MPGLNRGAERRNCRSLCLALVVALIAGCAPRAPELPGPVDVPPVPPRTEPAPRATPLPLVSGPFAYTPGSYAYEVVTESAIRQAGDSSHADTAEAHVRTVALFTLAIDHLSGDSIRVNLTMDSLAAERDSQVPPPEEPVAPDSVTAPPLAFTTTMHAQGGLPGGSSNPGGECAAGESLLDVARDLLIAVPPVLTVGARWSDTTSVAICRGGVQVTTGAVRDFEVIGTRRDADGAPLMRIARDTRFSLAGTETTEYRQVIALTGRGESRALLELDLDAGIVRSATREGTADLIVTYGRTSTPFTQRVVQRVRLIDAGEPLR